MKTSKYMIMAVGMMVLLLSSQTLWAGILAGTKIGVIDMGRIMRDSKAAADARSMFLLDIESKKGVLKSKEQQILTMEKDLKSREMKKKDPAEVEAKKEEIAKAVKELRRLRDDMEEELKKKEQQLRSQLFQEIKGIVQAFLIQEKFAVVLERKTPIAFDEAIDITEKIIEIYDENR